MYYILSLTHTAHKDKFITLWRPENAGYCFSKANAGVYSEYKEGYHNNAGNMPLLINEAEKLMQEVEYFGTQIIVLPNTRTVLQKLKLKRIKGELTKASA